MAAKRFLHINLDDKPEILSVLTRLHVKTGIKNSIEIVRMALQMLDANLPHAPSHVAQPDNSGSGDAS